MNEVRIAPRMAVPTTRPTDKTVYSACSQGPTQELTEVPGRQVGHDEVICPGQAPTPTVWFSVRATGPLLQYRRTAMRCLPQGQPTTLHTLHPVKDPHENQQRFPAADWWHWDRSHSIALARTKEDVPRNDLRHKGNFNRTDLLVLSLGGASGTTLVLG